MEGALLLSSLAVVFLSQLWSSNSLCNLESSTLARCSELDDVRYIEVYNLEALKASVDDEVLQAGLFSNLTSLRHLDLSGGELKSVEPGSFEELDQLRSLDLSDNSLDYLELASLNGLHHLHSLNLRRNNLTQLPPALLRLKSLRHLDIQGNPFECNCATLRVRDLLVKRGVKLSKKVICIGPGNMKGTSLLKPDTEVICAFEEQDKDMQNDQAVEGSGDIGSGEPFDEWSTEDEIENKKEEPVIVEESSIGPTEIETPFPETVPVTSTTEEITADEVPVNKTAEDDPELFFDSEEKNSTTEAAGKKEIKDGLFYPVEEGSGDEDEGSGIEGSGTGIVPLVNEEIDNEHEVTSAKPSTTESEGLFDMLWGAFWGTTDTPEEDKGTDLEDEEFINVSTSESVPEVQEELVPAVTHHPVAAEPEVKRNQIQPKSSVPTNNADLSLFDESKADDKFNAAVKADDSVEDIAEVSPAKQSKKGMGSYVVLAALLVVLAALIGFAAYKGDFCRKKRKRNDIETGTELKDMQKALLEVGNSTQPKISSNGNAENAPLMSNSNHQDDLKAAEAYQKSSLNTVDSPRSTNGTTVVDSSDPVKPPRKAATPQEESAKVHETPVPESPSADSTGPNNIHSKDDSLPVTKSPVEPVVSTIPKDDAVSCEPQQSNGPPLSPGAQRVKITLQENPDSVPRTPILITRTLAGENLVKTP